MPLQLFTPSMATPKPHPFYVTIRPDLRLSFNAQTSRALQAASIRCVRLFGDRLTKKIVIRPAPNNATDGHLITYVRPSLYQIRASLEAAPFLRWLGYTTQPTTRYPVSQLPRHAFVFCLTVATNFNKQEI